MARKEQITSTVHSLFQNGENNFSKLSSLIFQLWQAKMLER